MFHERSAGSSCSNLGEGVKMEGHVFFGIGLLTGSVVRGWMKVKVGDDLICLELRWLSPRVRNADGSVPEWKQRWRSVVNKECYGQV